MSAADMLDDALDDEPEFCFCGLAIDPGQLWCGIDPACRAQAAMEYPEH